MSLNQSQIGLRAVDLKNHLQVSCSKDFENGPVGQVEILETLLQTNLLKAEEVAEERRAFHQRLEERRGMEDSLDSSSIRQDICQKLNS